jgi:2'-5' RNA ligase
MACCQQGAEGLVCYALVAYIPDPLGRYLDEVRRQLVPNFIPHAHVTILPPRLLPIDAQSGLDELRPLLEDFPAFTVDLAEVEMFSRTSVIYIALGRGAKELRSMHDLLNTGRLFYNEPYPFHPHVTLAQQLAEEQVPELYELSGLRWAEYKGPRSFEVERVTFVRNVAGTQWLDLGEFQLQPAQPVPLLAG